MITRANGQRIHHEHDDGKGGKCRFQGRVVDGKLRANSDNAVTKKCVSCKRQKVQEEYRENEWNKRGPHASRRKCNQCWDDVERKKCYVCKELRSQDEYPAMEWDKKGANANRRKCNECSNGR